MIEYSVEPSTISPYQYKRPFVSVNDDGEINVNHSESSKGIVIKKITLLSISGYDGNGNLISYEPLDCVNQFLLAHHLDNSKLESDQLSRALAHYFEFIIANQKMWDLSYDEDTFDPIYDSPRPRWDYFSKRKPEKLTYQYRAALINLVLNQKDGMARSTAKAYMSAVVNFYKYHIRKGHLFNNPPFEHETIMLQFQSAHSNMHSYTNKAIHTTDLRLSFPKSSRNEGVLTNNNRRDLKPLLDKEWLQVNNILVNTKQVIKNVNGEMKMQSLAEEYRLAFMLCRYTGMRREEVASLHLKQIVKPLMVIRNGKEEYEKPFLFIGIGDMYGSLTKTKGEGNKSRKTIIPSKLMDRLYAYSQTKRYKTRLAKFKDYCQKQIAENNMAIFEGDDAINMDRDYFFISQSGIPFMARPADLTNRWVEVRNTVNRTTVLNSKMIGSIHNLRSTFAVNLFRTLLKKISSEKALAFVSSVLGHEDYKTTLEYLKIAEDVPGGDEIYEDILVYLGIFDEVDKALLTDEADKLNGRT